MHLFWDTIIEPVLHALKARRILEVGSDEGHNTRRLLDYCREIDGFLEVIDPLPKYEPETWFEPWQGHVGFHRDLSLNVLPRIEPIEVALIDGDHNWYTVYHELKLIDKVARQAGQPFPLVLLHDIGWPYGRRDLYYDPDTIPVGHRKPYRNQGLRYGESKLADTGGLNPHLCNSIYEHNHQNGVLTAIEDFLAEAGDALRFECLPGIHGLGILYPATLDANEDFARFMLEICPTSRQRCFMEMLEEQRLILQVRNAEQGFELRSLKRQEEQRSARLRELEQERTELTGQLVDTRHDHADLRERFTALEQDCATLAARLERAESELLLQQAEQARQNEIIQTLEQERDALNERLGVTETERATLTARLEATEAERVALADRCVHSEQTRHTLTQQLTQAESERDALGERLTQAESEHDLLRERLTETEAERDALGERLTQTESEHDTLRERLTESESERAALAQKNARAETANASLAQHLSQAEQAHAALTRQLAGVANERDVLAQQLTGITSERDAVAQKLTKAEGERATLKQRLAALNANLAATRTQSDKRLAAQEQRLAIQSRRAAELEAVLQRYRSGIERLEGDYQAVKASARWKIGHRIVRLIEILLLRGKPPLVMDHMGDILAAARHWGPRPAANVTPLPPARPSPPLLTQQQGRQ